MRRLVAVLMILLLTINLAPVARAVPLGVVGPSLSAGFLSGPVAPIVFTAGLITTVIIIEYPHIQDALTTVFNTALPSPQPDQEMPGPPGSPSLLEDLQSRNPGGSDDKGSKQKPGSTRRGDQRRTTLDNRPKKPKNADQSLQDPLNPSRVKHDATIDKARRAAKRRGYRLGPEEKPLKIGYYREKILRYFDKIKPLLRRHGVTEKQLRQIRSAILKADSRVVDLIVYKNGRKFYLEEKTGGHSVGPHDIYEVVVDSWINKNLGKVIWHFSSAKGVKKLIRLARAFGIKVWIGN